MNTKRQTIWLVSMLSLMVVLSAYYLFTEDASKLNATTGTTNIEDIKVDSTETNSNAADSVIADIAVKDKSTIVADSAAITKDKAAETVKSAGNTVDKAAETVKSAGETVDKAVDKVVSDVKVKITEKTDDKVLEDLAVQGKTSDDMFALEMTNRDEQLRKNTEDLMTKITDENASAEAVSQANSDLTLIQTNQAAVDNLESELNKEYNRVVITQDANKWKVIVQTDRLEKSQAVSIVDLVINELKIGIEKIGIQVVAQ